DCSGPWGDPNFKGNVTQGLPALRRNWILARGDVEEIAGPKNPASRSSELSSGVPLRAKSGKIVTQLEYARRGIITPEVEFIALRENLGLETEQRNLQAARSRDLGGESFGASIPNRITAEFVRHEVARGR